MQIDLTDQIAIVTGGASGMGAATARVFAAAGARVVIVDRDENLAQSVATEIGAEVQIGDVSDSGFCDATVAFALERFGRVDALVNAAGVIVRATGAETSDADWARIMGVNVNGLFFMCRAALRAMRTQALKPQGRGAIVNFGSIWGDLGASGVAAYCASKGAVHNLTRALALEHAADGIRVNAVCPGEVNTPMLRSERNEPVTNELMRRIADSVPMGRLAEPEEIARVVLFLASPASSYMTGSLVTVDAGYTAR